MVFQYPKFGTPMEPTASFPSTVYRAFVPPSQLHLPPGENEVWSTEGWVSHLLAYGKTLDYSCLARVLAGSTSLSQFSSLLAAALDDGQPLRVLDLGGSIGENLLQVFINIPPPFHRHIEWTVCDNARSIQTGRENFCGQPYQPRFTTYDELLASGDRFDVCLLCGTLHYLDAPLQAIQDIFDLLDRKRLGGIYVHRTPFGYTADEHVVIRQLIHPPFGPWKDLYVGETQLHLLSMNKFVDDLKKMGCDLRYLVYYRSYQDPMKALPEPFRDVHYIDMYIVRGPQSS